MKLDRLLAIIMILNNKKRVQARDLADMFDVSVRTVYRDIEVINLAGVPIITYQGANGGIGIAEGFRLDKNVLTYDELSSIVMALKSVSSSYSDPNITAALQKISGMVVNRPENFRLKADHIFIDFSPWGSEPRLKAKVTALKDAIERAKTVTFTYHSVRRANNKAHGGTAYSGA